MPVELSWPCRGVAMRRFEGLVTDADFVRSFEAIMGDARFDELRFNVADLSGVTAVEVFEETLEQLAAMAYGASHSNPHVKIAIVAPAHAARELAGR